MRAGSVQQIRLPAPGAGFRWERCGDLPLLRPEAGLRAAFTTRLGGVSEGAFATLNVSISVGDDPGRVRANHQRVAAAIGAGGEWSCVHQVHGAGLVPAPPPGVRPRADALWTDDPSRTLAVLAADCVPVLLAGEGRIAAVHAGWRGAVAGIVELAARAIGAHTAYAGPAIGPCCFRVGGEVARRFASRFGRGVLAGEDRVDLWAAVEAAARAGGVEAVYAARICTACHPELFFSHRRDGGRTGRQALVAALP